MTDAKTVEIREIPDLSASIVNLNKYNRSRIPGTFDIQYIGKGEDGRYLTGIDENSYEIQMLKLKNPAEGNKKAKEMLTLREELQIKLGIADLSANSTYWLNYKIRMHLLKRLDLSKAAHLLALRVMIANRFVMPDLSSQNKPEYVRTKYYVHSEVKESERKITNAADKDKAFSRLYNLYENKNPKLTALAKIFFRGRISEQTTVSEVYNSFKAWFAIEKKQENSSKFNEMYDIENEQLVIRDVIMSASEKGILAVKQKKYYFNQELLGKNLDEVYENMAKDKYSAVYQMITEALEK
jgi:hypothetical protein